MTENRMKRKKTGIIWLIFTIIWMSVIFSFSAKKAVESEDSGKRSMLICWCAGTAYAASDELHQLFVPGRSCQFRDVCIDSAGVLAGVLVFSLIKHEIVKYKEKKKSCKN